MLVPLREYTSASEMVSTLAVIRRGFMAPAQPVPVEEVAGVETTEAEPNPPTTAIQELSDPIESAPIRRVTVTEVLHAVRDVWGVQIVEIVSGRRNVRVLRPRQAAYALACRLTPFTLPHIGRMIGGRDHTSIIHGRNRMRPIMDAVEARMRPDANVREWAEEVFMEMNRHGHLLIQAHIRNRQSLMMKSNTGVGQHTGQIVCNGLQE